MQRLSLIALMALTASPVLAGGPVEPVPEATIAAPVAPARTSTDWSGFYVGLQYENLSGEIPGTITSDLDGTLYGINAGYRRDFGQWVLGGELDYVTGDGELSAALGTLPIDYDMLRLGVEAGLDAGRVLIYGTVGYADLSASLATGDLSGNGIFYGIGADFMVSERVIVGLEVLKHDFNDLETGTPATADVDATTVGLSAAWRF